MAVPEDGRAKTVQSALRSPDDVLGEQNTRPMEGSRALHSARECGRGGSGPLGTNGIKTGGDLAVEPAKELARWQSEGDPRLWKLIVSPEFGERRRP